MSSAAVEDQARSFTWDFIREKVSLQGLQHWGAFDGCLLTSAFQPIYSLSHKRIVGYEALMRAQDGRGEPVSPQEVFARQKDEAALIFLDRLCRCVHALNFHGLRDDLNWLFLNVDPQVVVSGRDYGPYFGELLSRCGLEPYRVVIEVVERFIHDPARIVEAADFYRDLGCLLAIDDFGAGLSNFERIWSINPHIVKLDRSMLIRASTQKRIRNVISGIVSLLHQAGSLVLMEGIETEEEAMIVMDSGADFAQGFFFARPCMCRTETWDATGSIEKLFSRYKEWRVSEEKASLERFSHHRRRFFHVAEMVRLEGVLGEETSKFFEDPDVVRCFLLAPDGTQIGDTVLSPLHGEKADKRFAPLEDASSADWFRRHYLKRALVHPEQLQVSRPYLSITGAHMCTTLSMAIQTSLGHRVLCCDLKGE